jgi:hypothetical protein
MATIKYPITSPCGIDAPIKKLQSLFAASLWSSNTYNVYARAFENVKKGGIVPEIYTGNNQYVDMFEDDTVDAMSFCVVKDSEPFSDAMFRGTVDIIFSVKLNKLYSTLTHRADETVLNDIMEIMKRNPYGFRPQSVSRGIDNVYSGYVFDNKIMNNLQPKFHVKITCELFYQQINKSC